MSSYYAVKISKIAKNVIKVCDFFDRVIVKCIIEWGVVGIVVLLLSIPKFVCFKIKQKMKQYSAEK